LGYIDHEALLWSYVVIVSDPLIPTHNHKTYDYLRGDYDYANDTIDLDLLFADNDISFNWNIFKDKVFEGCQRFIPMSSVVHKKSIGTPPWWTKSLSRTIQKKKSLYFKYCVGN